MYDKEKHYFVFGGGTVQHISPHLALSAPAYGKIAEQIYSALHKRLSKARGKSVCNVHLILTRMADPRGESRDTYVEDLFEDAGVSHIETNQDLEKVLHELKNREDTKAIIMTSALCDFLPTQLMSPEQGGIELPVGSKGVERLSSHLEYELTLSPARKLIQTIRVGRKDIFLVGFKTTSGLTQEEQYVKALALLKRGSCNLVVANDLKSKVNFIVTPEEARYHETPSREELATQLADMIFLRSQLTFTRSTVVAGTPVPWSSPEVPPALRAVVNHLIKEGAYKPFLGNTVGHFAVRLSDNEFLTSIRKTNFNDLEETGLVRIRTDGPDSVLAYGARPSVGGQSQRIVFQQHPGLDCIAHAHVPLKPGSKVPVVSQREYECGSHECGSNTSRGLGSFGRIHAVMLDQHGPNIVFPRDIDPAEVIAFIDENFDLKGKTGGLFIQDGLSS